jgi:hypothetical protein
MTGPVVPVASVAPVVPDVPVVPGTVLALKEWAAVVHALLDGRQTVLLRKGGIHEKRFSVRGSRFVVFPTVAHSHAESTRPEHAQLLALGLPDVADGSVVVRAELSVAATIAVRRPERIAELEPFHIWTTESVRRNRIDFRPRHELTAIVVSARALVVPLTVPLLPEYAGCRSWVDLVEVAGLGAVAEPVHDVDYLNDVAEQVRAAVG